MKLNEENKNKKKSMEIQPGLYLYHLEDLEDDRTLRMVAVNRIGAGIIGLSEGELVGKTHDEHFPGLREKGIPQGYGEVVRSGQPRQFEDVVYGNNGSALTHFFVRAFPLPDQHVAVLFENISEQRKADLKIQESDKKYRLLFENMLDAFALHEMIFDEKGSPVDYRFIDVNPAFEKHTLLKKADIIGKTVKEVLPGIENIWIETYGKVVLTGQPVRFEYYTETLASYFEVNAFRPKEGQFATIFTNITEQKIAEFELKDSLKEKELLLKEIHHRVKNNLAMVSSLLNIQGSYTKDEQARAAFVDIRQRINSIALIHEKLYLSTDLGSIEFGHYVRDLTDTLIKSYSIPSNLVETTIDIGDIYLNIDTAIPLGLIVTELVTNSLKYGFKDDQTLNLTIRLTSENHHLCMTVTDNGVGIPGDLDWRNTETQGIQLVILLTQQLEGQIQLERSKGTSFRITIPKHENHTPPE